MLSCSPCMPAVFISMVGICKNKLNIQQLNHARGHVSQQQKRREALSELIPMKIQVYLHPRFITIRSKGHCSLNRNHKLTSP